MDTASSAPSPGRKGPDEQGLQEVASRLHSTAIHLLRTLRTADVETGITPAKLSALSVLVFRGPRSVTELAAAERVSVPTMSRLVAALEERGLVTRRPDPSDGRAVRLKASPEGRKLLEEGRDRRLERLAGLLSRLDRRQVETVARSAELLESLMGRSGAG